jgi:hypothetical protein
MVTQLGVKAQQVKVIVRESLPPVRSTKGVVLPHPVLLMKVAEQGPGRGPPS